MKKRRSLIKNKNNKTIKLKLRINQANWEPTNLKKYLINQQLNKNSRVKLIMEKDYCLEVNILKKLLLAKMLFGLIQKVVRMTLQPSSDSVSSIDSLSKANYSYGCF